MGEAAVVRLIERPTVWRQQVERFLETKMSDSLSAGSSFSVAENLDTGKIEALIFERAPFLCVDKAVILSQGGVKTILTKSVVTKETCDGHFPGKMIIPLLVFSKIIALTGEILVAWVKKSDIVPLAIRAGEVKAVSTILVSPPTLVITKAQFIREKGPYCWVTANAWVGNEKVAQIKELVYFLMPTDQFFSSAQHGIQLG